MSHRGLVGIGKTQVNLGMVAWFVWGSLTVERPKCPYNAEHVLGQGAHGGPCTLGVPHEGFMISHDSGVGRCHVLGWPSQRLPCSWYW